MFRIDYLDCMANTGGHSSMVSWYGDQERKKRGIFVGEVKTPDITTVKRASGENRWERRLTNNCMYLNNNVYILYLNSKCVSVLKNR